MQSVRTQLRQITKVLCFCGTFYKYITLYITHRGMICIIPTVDKLPQTCYMYKKAHTLTKNTHLIEGDIF